MALGLALLVGAAASSAAAQNPTGEWRYWGADPSSTRYSPLDQINAQNFGSLEVAWTWRGDNFGSSVDYILHATPIYARGKLFTVAGTRRTVAAIDPATGETLWTYREPHTVRYERSERFNYGRGVAYGEVDGRGIIYMVSPAFFLHALDAETGDPIEGFGGQVPVAGFPKTGVVDMLAALGHPFDPNTGLPRDSGTITTASPPIVVNGVIVVGSSGSRGRYNTRIENVPGDILAFDQRTGRHLWTFKVIPGPGEFGHDTWENDAWKFTGNINSWPPLSADLERGIVYVLPDAPTNDYNGSMRPGNNLFGNTIVALDARTGRRLWHFQTVHHDIWDYDTPVAPIIMDVTVNGQRIPAIVQTSKQAFAYAYNRVTGEPLWPIVERPVPQSQVPNERLSPTQPIPTLPPGYEMQGITENDLIDFTPELRAEAVNTMKSFLMGPIFNPGVHQGNAQNLRGGMQCPGNDGGTNIQGGPAADPETGIIYVESVKACVARLLVPGSERDDPNSIFTAGSTVTDWVTGGGGAAGPAGLPIFKPPYGRISAIDMNTGRILWWIPNGDTPDRIKSNPRLAGLTIPPTGSPSHASIMVTKSLMMYGEGRGGRALFHAVDKRTGQEVGQIELPAPTNTAPMTFLHNGVQYIVAAVGSNTMPGSLVALRVPPAGVGGGGRGGGPGGGDQ